MNGQLVIDQGSILDRIDYNMEQVVETTKHGVVEITKATQHQKQAVPEKCIMILVVIIFVLLAILVFKHS